MLNEEHYIILDTDNGVREQVVREGAKMFYYMGILPNILFWWNWGDFLKPLEAEDRKFSVSFTGVE